MPCSAVECYVMICSVRLCRVLSLSCSVLSCSVECCCVMSYSSKVRCSVMLMFCSGCSVMCCSVLSCSVMLCCVMLCSVAFVEGARRDTRGFSGTIGDTRDNWGSGGRGMQGGGVREVCS